MLAAIARGVSMLKYQTSQAPIVRENVKIIRVMRPTTCRLKGILMLKKSPLLTKLFITVVRKKASEKRITINKASFT